MGSVHGNSVGVHASDAANAWRNIARVTNARNTFASLIVAAFQTTIRPELRAFSVERGTAAVARAPGEDHGQGRRDACCTTPRPPSKPRTRQGPRPWSIATAN